MADGTPQAEFNIPYREVKGFTGLGVRVLRFPYEVPDRARCKHCNCIPKRIYHLLCPHHGLCFDCKKHCNGYYCDECCVNTAPEQLGAIRSDFNLPGILQQVQCDVCHKVLLLGKLEEHLYEHTNQGDVECSKVQETTNQHQDVSEKPLRFSDVVSVRCDICNEIVKNSDYVEHLKRHTQERNNQCDPIVQETPNQDAAMEFEETRSDETHPHTGYKEHSLDGVCNVTLEYKNAEHCEKSDKDPVICSGCGLFVQRNNMQKHTYLSCPERIIFCERCHSSFPCSMEETHKSQCPKMERECSDWDVNVLNENLQHYLDTECQKRVVLCGACNSMMCYDERGKHRSECPKIERKCPDCGVNVLNENLQNHQDMECQNRVVLCDARNGAVFYHTLGDHEEECLEKPLVCEDCKGEILRKDESKHASECPMRAVCCENCDGFYPYSSEKEHRSECPKIEKSCSDCGVKVLNENLQSHQEVECQMRVVFCGACKSAMSYYKLGVHDQVCPEKPVVCDDCKGEVLRKDESKHASECPMRVVCCENCEGSYAYSSEKEHRKQCELKKLACEYCKLYLKGDDEKKAHLKICEEASIECAFKDFGCKEKFPRKEMQEHEKDPHNALLNQVILKAMDTISELQQKIKDMERCNMSLQEEAKNEKAKLVKKIQELENRQMSKQEEARNENAKLVKRIQELENRQLEADQYRIDLEDDVKVHRTVLQNLEDKVGRISREAVTRRRVDTLNE